MIAAIVPTIRRMGHRQLVGDVVHSHDRTGHPVRILRRDHAAKALGGLAPKVSQQPSRSAMTDPALEGLVYLESRTPNPLKLVFPSRSGTIPYPKQRTKSVEEGPGHRILLGHAR